MGLIGSTCTGLPRAAAAAVAGIFVGEYTSDLCCSSGFGLCTDPAKLLVRRCGEGDVAAEVGDAAAGDAAAAAAAAAAAGEVAAAPPRVPPRSALFGERGALGI